MFQLTISFPGNESNKKNTYCAKDLQQLADCKGLPFTTVLGTIMSSLQSKTPRDTSDILFSVLYKLNTGIPFLNPDASEKEKIRIFEKHLKKALARYKKP